MKYNSAGKKIANFYMLKETRTAIGTGLMAAF